MATQAISIWANVLGVWKRVDPPHVKVSGAWKEVTNVWVKVSGVWKLCFTNIVGEIAPVSRSASDLDISSPYYVEAGLFFNSDGTIDRKIGNATYAEIDSWRPYDVGRDYEIRFQDNGSHNIDTVPTLNSWLNLTDPATNHEIESVLSVVGIEAGSFTVGFREKITAPAGGDESATYSVNVEAAAL